jgi:hypothetical protein
MTQKQQRTNDASADMIGVMEDSIDDSHSPLYLLSAVVALI